MSDLDPTTFRWDPDQGVLWAGVRSYPATFHRASMSEDIPPDDDFWVKVPDYRFETRHAWVHFENQWQLSTTWGDATYSSNRMTLGATMPFIEEPTTVEVGVLPPVIGLWGEPLSHVNVPEYHRLADLVMNLPNDIDLPEGEWDDVEGFCDLLITAGLEKTL